MAADRKHTLIATLARNGGEPLQPDRRTTLKWLSAALAAGPLAACGADLAGVDWAGPPPLDAPGYGTDPDLLEPVVPWPLTLTGQELGVVAALVDLILPAEGASPSASMVGAPAFINEWVSAPYEQQRADRTLILPGLAWLEAEAGKRFSRSFLDIPDARRIEIIEDIAFPARSRPELERPVAFFSRMRSLTMGAYFSTPEGWRELGYVGNQPSSGPYAGPTAEALAHIRKVIEGLGLTPP